MKSLSFIVPYATLWLILACGSTASAQMSAAEHASHHAKPPGGASASPMASPSTQNVPPPASAGPAATPPAQGGAGMAAGGMQAGQPDAAAGGMGGGEAAGMGGGEAGGMGGGKGGGMGEMMKGMGTAPTKEIYPTLMALPDGINADQRLAIDLLARERMNGGTAALSAGLEKLSAATSDQNYAGMQQATEQMHEGLADFESGVAGQRVIAEGKAPRNVALDWFRREMNLASGIPSAQPYTVFGMVPIHLFTMVLLLAFALAMVAMYYFKMRRAAALFGRIDPDKKPPPRNAPSAPAGEPGPAAPKPPKPGGSPPVEPPKPPAPGTPPPEATPPPAGPTKSPVPEAPPPEAKPTTEPGIAPTGEPPAAPDSNEEKSNAKSQEPPGAGTSQPTPPGPKAVSAPSAPANWRGRLRIASIVKETPSVKTFRLVPSDNNHVLPFTFRPGQFLNVAFYIGGTKMNRSYSISSSPNEREHVDLTIRREPRGAVSRHIDDLLSVGDQIDVDGPVGKFIFIGEEAESVVLISGGVGITPMMSITRYLTERSWGGDIYFLYTCRTPADFVFADQFPDLQRRNPKLHLSVTVSKPEGTNWTGARGRMNKEWLTETVPDLASRLVYLVGPPPMMDTIKSIFLELGASPDRMKTEIFGAVKPAPAAPGIAKKPKGPATGPEVTFSKNNKSAKIRLDLTTGDSPPKQSILELSEELSIGIDFSCRIGVCGVCKVKKTSGDVDQEVQDALTDDDKAKNIILACQAKPKGPVTVEA